MPPTIALATGGKLHEYHNEFLESASDAIKQEFGGMKNFDTTTFEVCPKSDYIIPGEKYQYITFNLYFKDNSEIKKEEVHMFGWKQL